MRGALALALPQDRFFCSHPGPTYPNRQFVHSGTAHGETDDEVPKPGCSNFDIIFGPCLTLFSAPPHPRRAVSYAILSAHAIRVLLALVIRCFFNFLIFFTPDSCHQFSAEDHLPTARGEREGLEGILDLGLILIIS